MKNLSYYGLAEFSESPEYQPPSDSSKPFEKMISTTLPIVQQDEYFSKILSDLQGNILMHHHRNFAYHYFIHFKDDNIKKALNWIEKIAVKITTANQQFEEKKISNKPVCCFYLTSKGYVALGLGHVAPSSDVNSAFVKGMRQSVPLTFQDGDDSPFKKREIHAMLILACNDPNLGNLPDEFDIKGWNTPDLRGSTDWKEFEWSEVYLQVGFLKKKALGPNGKSVNEDGKPMDGVDGNGNLVENEKTAAIEWFGYRDGISQPLFFPEKQEIGNFSSEDLSHLRVVLTKDRRGEWYSAGSFLAFLKLEQDVTAFNEMIDKLANSIPSANQRTSNKEFAEAYVMGRFKDGTPVTLYDTPQEHIRDFPDNDFRYSDNFITNEGANLAFNDENGTRCPFHAHIRKANPRDEKDTRLIARRGMLYDDRKNCALRKKDILKTEDKKGLLNWKDWDNATNKPPGSNEPLGLLFMSFQSSLEEQFEYILIKWIQSDRASSGDYRGMDILSGTTEKRNLQTWVIPKSWNAEKSTDIVPLNNVGVAPCVKFKGGEYFYAPPISFLKTVGFYSTFH